MHNDKQAPKAPLSRTKIIAAVAIAFGALTVFSGGTVLFGPDALRVTAGNYIGFVLWFNFLAGGFYILAGLGIWLGKTWGAALSGLIAFATACVALGFVFVVLRGAPFEIRTVGALALRFSFWVVATIVTRRALRAA